jgi:hypothetical protein
MTHERDDAERGLPPPDPTPGTDPPDMLPDLYAGEISAAGRMLVVMSANIARHALHLADLAVEALAVANQLSEAASVPPFRDTPNGRMLEGMASRLRAALARCQTG